MKTTTATATSLALLAALFQLVDASPPLGLMGSPDIVKAYGAQAGLQHLVANVSQPLSGLDTHGHGVGLGRRAAKAGYTNAFAYGSKKVRGVNLGGWLVLEPWITPSIFTSTGDSKVIDEFTYGKKYGTVEAAKRLQKHRDTWITERDFQLIASYGLNHVRLPVGHWAYDIQGDEKYPQGQLPYVKKAVEWARKYGIKVLIDIHGAPGSQNGYDNSGRMGNANWPNSANNVERTKAVLRRLAADFANDKDVVTAISPLNEPAGYLSKTLLNTARSYHDAAYNIVRDTYPDVLINYADAFQPASQWKGYQTASSFKGVSFDTHYYTVFSDDELKLTKSQRLAAACAKGKDLAKYSQLAFVGEWTAATTDCAGSLHGRGHAANYDGSAGGSQLRLGSCKDKTGNGKNFSQDYKDLLRAHWEAQATSWETNGDGWIMWTWKTESASDWSYHSGVTGGWIPKNPTERKFPNPCS